MARSDDSPAAPERSPTTHAMLIVWGHFAREIGLLDRLANLPIPQKTVRHAPQAKLTEFFLGLLSGIEFLTDLSEGATPLVLDREVALAWQLPALADASGVSRTLKRCDAATLAALQAALAAVAQPFLARALADLRERHETLVLDADLTGRPVSSTSRSYPGAAFGYMDGAVRLGYQLAEICLQTRLFGRQWLSARHHSGNRVSAASARGALARSTGARPAAASPGECGRAGAPGAGSGASQRARAAASALGATGARECPPSRPTPLQTARRCRLLQRRELDRLARAGLRGGNQVGQCRPAAGLEAAGGDRWALDAGRQERRADRLAQLPAHDLPLPADGGPGAVSHPQRGAACRPDPQPRGA